MNDLADMNGLIEELSLGTARGGRKQGARVSVAVVRPLAEGDLELLANPPNSGTGALAPQELKHQHHQLAGLIAKGMSNTEISLVLGFSPSYISMLKSSPDMKELVSYYSTQAEQRTVDALARMKQLGVSSIEELQNRLNTDPSKFTSSQLMDMIELGLIKPMEVGASAQGNNRVGPGIEINLNFKAPELAGDSAKLIEGKAKSGI